jgi:glycosyltransferase involved in cell wall biosynthesis
MESGGAERQVTYLAKGFIELGHEVHVVLISEGANYDRLLRSGAYVHSVNIYPKAFHFVAPIVRLFQTINPDIVYLWQRPFEVLGGIAAFIAGIPSIHAERTDPAKVAPSLKVWLRNIILQNSKAIISNSDAGVFYWMQRTKDVLVSKIPNIIPYEEIRIVQPSDESKEHFVMICRLDSNKNVITLLRAVKLLDQKDIRINVLVVGDGPESDGLIKFAEDHSISDRIKFAGYRNDVWSLLKGCKCFVSLSYYEGEPNVVLEAAALGCRMILSDIPAHRSIEGLIDVVFVNPKSVEEVATVLQSLKSKVYVPNNTFILEGSNRHVVSVCSQHLAVFSQASAK